MKIAVTSTGSTLDDQVESRFGRCPFFLIVDTETLVLEAVPNPNVSLGGGAGIQSAQMMADQGVSTVLTGNCGPNAYRVFGAAGIQIVTGVNGRVREAVDQFKSGRLSPSTAPNVESHYGMRGGKMSGRGGGGGMGMGRGMGMGGGGGMGTGRGMGMGGGGGMGTGRGMGMGGGGGSRGSTVMRSGTTSLGNAPTDGNDIAQLRETADNLRRQLEAIEQKLTRIADKT